MAPRPISSRISYRPKRRWVEVFIPHGQTLANRNKCSRIGLNTSVLGWVTGVTARFPWAHGGLLQVPAIQPETHSVATKLGGGADENTSTNRRRYSNSCRVVDRHFGGPVFLGIGRS